MLLLLLGERLWDTAQRGCYSKKSSLGVTPPALPSSSWLPFSLRASQAPFGSSRCGDTGFFGKFPSCSHAVLSSTSQIVPLIPLRTDQRQLLREWTGLNFWIKSDGKRDEGHRALSGGPGAPRELRQSDWIQARSQITGRPGFLFLCYEIWKRNLEIHLTYTKNVQWFLFCCLL